MKILYIDVAVDGHHLEYLEGLLSIPSNENVLVVPEKITSLNTRQYVYNKVDLYKKRFIPYIKWILEIRSIIKKEKPDVVHFLYGDVFYKYFGIGLESLKIKSGVIVTIHGLKKGKIGILSLRRIFRLSDIGVVHTNNIYKELKTNNIKNVSHVEYPSFSKKGTINKSDARNYYGIEEKGVVLACIGATRFDKGIDILLKALKNTDLEYTLLIAGSESDVKINEINQLIDSYSAKVKVYLKYLSDAEFEMAVCASDIIVLPYRRMFNGASGPLVEGVVHEKMIIGPEHGSLGEIITTNHLGHTFETENVSSLSTVLEKVINEKFEYDRTALKYKDSLSVESFKDSYEKLYSLCIN